MKKFGSKKMNKKGDSNFVRVGSVTVTKKSIEKMGDELKDHFLEAEGATISIGFFLPKGVQSMEITNNTKMFINFGQNENSPDFVIGSVSVLED